VWRALELPEQEVAEVLHLEGLAACASRAVAPLGERQEALVPAAALVTAIHLEDPSRDQLLEKLQELMGSAPRPRAPVEQWRVHPSE